MDRIDSDMVPRAEYDAVARQAAEYAAHICRSAAEQSAIRRGCPPGQAHIVSTVLADRLRMVDGQPRYIETRTAEDGQPVDIAHDVDHGIDAVAREHGYLFRSGEPQLPAGDIDPAKLSGAEYAQIRQMPGGKEKLGLVKP